MDSKLQLHMDLIQIGTKNGPFYLLGVGNKGFEFHELLGVGRTGQSFLGNSLIFQTQPSSEKTENEYGCIMLVLIEYGTDIVASYSLLALVWFSDILRRSLVAISSALWANFLINSSQCTSNIPSLITCKRQKVTYWHYQNVFMHVCAAQGNKPTLRDL